jgi:ABC-type dipeptide/oligopeptide/nickel transport system ATPase component
VSGPAGPGGPLLTVRDLRSYLATGHGVVRAVDGVSFTLHGAEILGIVGESGCGKTVTCRTIMGLLPRGTAYTSGEVIYHPRGDRSILSASTAQLQDLRGSQLAMIFQDPMTALNPVLRIGDQLLEASTRMPGCPGATPAPGRSTCSPGSASRPRRGGCGTTRSSSAAGCCSGR